MMDLDAKLRMYKYWRCYVKEDGSVCTVPNKWESDLKFSIKLPKPVQYIKFKVNILKNRSGSNVAGTLNRPFDFEFLEGTSE